MRRRCQVAMARMEIPSAAHAQPLRGDLAAQLACLHMHAV